MATLTIKGIPDRLYEEIKKRAAASHRSISQHAIILLEQALTLPSIDVKAWLEETARLRKRWNMKPMTMAEIDAAKRKGATMIVTDSDART